ncbi:hypothetical protein [Solibacillus cecembensis]|uniref:hypothetical protein n=1 Tax=Solibacillus cecembensis TaxID=459347 RepID=UPI003AA30410
MKTNSSFKKSVFLFGFFLFISGLVRFIGAFDFNTFIPNESVALTYILLGNGLIIASGFLKPRINH